MNETYLDITQQFLDYCDDEKGNLYTFFVSQKDDVLDSWLKNHEMEKEDDEIGCLSLAAYFMEMRERGHTEIRMTHEELFEVIKKGVGMCLLAKVEKEGYIVVLDGHKYFNLENGVKVLSWTGIGESELFEKIRGYR